MLYPKIANIKKQNLTLTFMVILSCVIVIASLIINILVNKQINWSFLVLGAIIYIWTTTIYSIRENKNMAFHIMLQLIAISIFTVWIDASLGYRGWSFQYAIPIATMAANITMSMINIIKAKYYLKYVIYHVIIFLLSCLSLPLIFTTLVTKPLLNIISLVIAGITFLIAIFLSYKDIRQELARRFHI